MLTRGHFLSMWKKKLLTNDFVRYFIFSFKSNNLKCVVYVHQWFNSARLSILLEISSTMKKYTNYFMSFWRKGNKIHASHLDCKTFPILWNRLTLKMKVSWSDVLRALIFWYLLNIQSDLCAWHSSLLINLRRNYRLQHHTE